MGAGEVSATVQRHRVRLQNDGSLKGEANIIDERTGRVRETLDLTVHFVKDGVNVASSEIANDGSFIATGLSPGVHSIVAVGQDGIMVTAVDLVGMNDEDHQAQRRWRPVYARQRRGRFLDFLGFPGWAGKC